jgi:hypothetical protein
VVGNDTVTHLGPWLGELLMGDAFFSWRVMRHDEVGHVEVVGRIQIRTTVEDEGSVTVGAQRPIQVGAWSGPEEVVELAGHAAAAAMRFREFLTEVAQ